MKKLNLVLAISTALGLIACGGSSSNDDAAHDPTTRPDSSAGKSYNGGYYHGGDTTNQPTNQSEPKPTENKPAVVFGVSGGGRGSSSGSSNTNPAPVKPDDGKKNTDPTPPQTEPEKKIAFHVTTLSDDNDRTFNESSETKDTSNPIEDMTRLLKEKSILSNNENLPVSKIGEVAITQDNQDDKIQYFNWSLNHSQFGTITTDPKEKALPADVESYTIGQPTEDFRAVADKIATYEGNALISSVKQGEDTKTLQGTMEATVKFNAPNDSDAFNGEIRVQEKVIKQEGENARADDFLRISLQSPISTTDHTFQSAEGAPTTFKGKFYGENAAEIGGVVKGTDPSYGDYKGAFGGKQKTLGTPLPPPPAPPSLSLDEMLGKQEFHYLTTDNTLGNQKTEQPTTMSKAMQEAGIFLDVGKGSEATELTGSDGVSKIVFDDAGTTYSYYNKPLSYSNFGSIAANTKDVMADISGYSIGVATEDFNKVMNKTAQYQGSAIISTGKDTEKTKTFLGDLTATVNFAGAGYSDNGFDGTIKVNKQVTDKGTKDPDQKFSDIELKGRVLAGAAGNSFNGDGVDGKLKFGGKFYGENATEIGGVVKGTDKNYGDYEGAFGGTRTGALTEITHDSDDSQSQEPPKPTPAAQLSERDTKLGQKEFYYLQANNISNFTVKTEKPKLSEAMQDQGFLPKGSQLNEMEIIELAKSGGVNKATSNDDPIIFSYYDKPLSYSSFGTTTTDYKETEGFGSIPTGINDIDGYSIGVATKNFENVKNGTATYNGDAIISAVDEGKAKTFLGDLTATVDFAKSLSLDQSGFNGKIEVNKVVENDSASPLEKPFSPIELKGGITAVDADLNVFYGGGNGKPEFRGKFYGEDAAEIGGVVTGTDENYGDYKGAFGGIKQ